MQSKFIINELQLTSYLKRIIFLCSSFITFILYLISIESDTIFSILRIQSFIIFIKYITSTIYFQLTDISLIFWLIQSLLSYFVLTIKIIFSIEQIYE